MNKQDVGKLLTLAALVDNRTVTDEAVLMWHEIIGDIDYADALRAVKDHYDQTTKWMMPADVRRHVTRRRMLELPSTMSPEAPESCETGHHRTLPDGTCMICTWRPDHD